MPQKIQHVTFVDYWTDATIGERTGEVRTNLRVGSPIAFQGKAYRVAKLHYPSDHRTVAFLRPLEV